MVQLGRDDPQIKPTNPLSHSTHTSTYLTSSADWRKTFCGTVLGLVCTSGLSQCAPQSAARCLSEGIRSQPRLPYQIASTGPYNSLATPGPKPRSFVHSTRHCFDEKIRESPLVQSEGWQASERLPAVRLQNSNFGAPVYIWESSYTLEKNYLFGRERERERESWGNEWGAVRKRGLVGKLRRRLNASGFGLLNEKLTTCEIVSQPVPTRTNLQPFPGSIVDAGTGSISSGRCYQRNRVEFHSGERIENWQISSTVVATFSFWKRKLPFLHVIFWFFWSPFIRKFGKKI